MKDIEYIKVKLYLKISENSILSEDKNPMFTGAILNELLKLYCINENCDKCNIRYSCIIQRLLNNGYERKKPLVMQNEDISPIFLVYSSDSKERFNMGEILEIELTLLKEAVNFLSQFIFIFHKIGAKGVGKNKLKYELIKVMNFKKEPIYEYGVFYDKNIIFQSNNEYVNLRKKHMGDLNKIVFKKFLPHTLEKEILKSDIDNIIYSLEKRLKELDIMEDNEDLSGKIRTIKNFNFRLSKRKYILKRENIQLNLVFLSGELEFISLDERLIECFLCGEILNIGKNVLLGYGNYKMEGVSRWKEEIL